MSPIDLIRLRRYDQDGGLDGVYRMMVASFFGIASSGREDGDRYGL